MVILTCDILRRRMKAPESPLSLLAMPEVQIYRDPRIAQGAGEPSDVAESVIGLRVCGRERLPLPKDEKR